MKFNVLILSFCLVFIRLGGQEVLHITDFETGLPLINTSVYETTLNVFVSTDSLGQVEVSEFKEGKEITVQLLGYNIAVYTYAQLVALNFEVKLSALSFPIGEIKVSATRWSQPLDNIPAKISSIPIENSSILHTQTTADLLGSSGEVYIQKSQQGGGSPMIRGFSANRLLYVVDGVRMNTAIFRGGNVHNVISLDPFSLQRMEVLFGPSSALYGSDAIGGVMSFSTLRPKLYTKGVSKTEFRALTRYATANQEKTAHAHFEWRTKTFSSLTSFSFTDYGHLKMGENGPEDYLRYSYVERKNDWDMMIENSNPSMQVSTAYQQTNFMQKFRFKPSQYWDLNYGFHYSESSNIDRYDRHLRTKDDEPYYGEWYYGPQRWMMHNLQLLHSKPVKLYDQLSAIIAYQKFDESRISRNFSNAKRYKRLEQVDAYSINIDLQKQLVRKHQLSYGAEWVLNDVDSKGFQQDIIQNTEVKGPSRYPQASWSAAALYAKDAWKIHPKWFLEASARINYFNLEATFDTTFYPLPYSQTKLKNVALTGGLGAVFKPSDKWMWSFTLSNGFRAPNVDDMGKVFDSEPGSVVVPNPDLKPEYAYNAEIGCTRLWKNSVKIDFHAYYTYLNNAMVRRDYTLNEMDSIPYDGEMSRVQAIQNAAYGHVYGLQTGAEARLMKDLKIISQFNWQVGMEELEDGSLGPSRHAAPWFGLTRLIYYKPKWQVNIYANYSGEKSFNDLPKSEQNKEFIYAKDANGLPYSPAWYTLNMSAAYSIHKSLQAILGIENITNQRYRPYSSGLAGAGVGVSGTLKFYL